MAVFVSLLRGINVGGRKQLSMDSLRGIYSHLGFTNVRSYVQSGNVVFESDGTDLASLTRRIEAGIADSSGYAVPIFIRQAHELQNILEHNPFLATRNEDPRLLHVSFLYRPVPGSAWEKVIPPPGITDAFSHRGGEIYLFCPNGYGKSKLSNSFFERVLGMPVTTRNWNTVSALYRLALE